jgi:hypothetical protein
VVVPPPTVAVCHDAGALYAQLIQHAHHCCCHLVSSGHLAAAQQQTAQTAAELTRQAAEYNMLQHPVLLKCARRGMQQSVLAAVVEQELAIHTFLWGLLGGWQMQQCQQICVDNHFRHMSASIAG